MGIERRIDNLGRITAPSEMRRSLGVTYGDKVDMTMEGNKLIIKKVHEKCSFCGSTHNLKDFCGHLICKKCIENIINNYKLK